MASSQSPRPFSALGFAEIIRELRELIKDLQYRNTQERIQGELDITERQINRGIVLAFNSKQIALKDTDDHL